MRPRLHMMMIAINSKRALEKWILPVPLNHYPRPSNVCPFRTGVML
jgi:hypothetical protein